MQKCTKKDYSCKAYGSNIQLDRNPISFSSFICNTSNNSIDTLGIDFIEVKGSIHFFSKAFCQLKSWESGANGLKTFENGH